MDSMTSEEFLAKFAKPEASPSRVQGGKRAGASGKDFEECLDITHQHYRLDGIADVYKLPVNTAPMPRSWLANPKMGGIARILSERQRGDYAGFLKGGRAIAMEAKATTERARSMPIIKSGAKGSGLKEHQLKALAEAHQWGAVSALVWRNGDDRLVFPGEVLTRLYQDFRLGTVRRIDRSLGHAYQVDGFREQWLRGDILGF